ncbi:MAG: hypothetical protein LCH44_08225 [Bacteroidetes bacterium]|jgi:hypothetical protein|nr:hypothetical protein [Bacteroidota bacterium]
MNYQPFLSILIFYCALCVPAQAQSGFVVCGSNAVDGGKSMSLTIGQIDYLNAVQSGIFLVNHGIQQPYETSNTSSTTYPFSEFKIIFFPNPTASCFCTTLKDI